jgi:hypothetical protein
MPLLPRGDEIPTGPSRTNNNFSSHWVDSQRPQLQMDPALTKNLFPCGVMNRYINIVIISIRPGAAYEGGVSGNGLSGDGWPKVL